MFPFITKYAIVLLIIKLGLLRTVGGKRYPNVVIMIADDLGIGDLGCYGNDTINTPNIDKLASEGVKLTHHLAVDAVCTPSRAGLLTARYPARYGLVGDRGTPFVINHVASRVGLPISEVTLATVLAAVNYTTALVGKWHLGSNCGLFGSGCNGPEQHGFQNFYGLIHTLLIELVGDHAFWIFPLDEPFYQALSGTWLLIVVTLIIAKLKFSSKSCSIVLSGTLFTLFSGLLWLLNTHYRLHTDTWWDVSPWMEKHMNSPLMHNGKVIEQPLNLDTLTHKLMNYSIQFIKDHAKDAHPFFLCHAFGQVHTPMFEVTGSNSRNRHGRYGANVEEMDAGVGIIMETLSNFGLHENTIVYFVSDHGGHLEVIDEHGQRIGGHNGLFKGGKMQGASEGGIRVPGIYKWKGHLPPAVSIGTPTSLMDLMPTILQLAGLPPLQELMPHRAPRTLDGISIADLLTQESDAEQRIFIHHCGRSIHALRWSQANHVYKMFLKRYKYPENSTQCGWGDYAFCSCFDVLDISYKPLLFDLQNDPYEDYPIPSSTTEYQKVVGYLKSYLSEWRKRVPYPPSQLRNKWDTMHSPWLQPFPIWS